ncbi:SDR family NAD(P)-dependent oxidoreductase [Lysobacter sp. TAF61]
MSPVVCITGGSRGIGLGAAHALGRAGCDVIAVARTARVPSGLDSPGIQGMQADLGRAEGLLRLVDRLVAVGRPVFLVNNAAAVADAAADEQAIHEAFVVTACAASFLTERLHAAGALHGVVDVLSGSRLQLHNNHLPGARPGLTGYFQGKELMRLAQRHLRQALGLRWVQFRPRGARTGLQSSLTEPSLALLPAPLARLLRWLDQGTLRCPEVEGRHLARSVIELLASTRTRSMPSHLSEPEPGLSAAAHRWVSGIVQVNYPAREANRVNARSVTSQRSGVDLAAPRPNYFTLAPAIGRRQDPEVARGKTAGPACDMSTTTDHR